MEPTSANKFTRITLIEWVAGRLQAAGVGFGHGTDNAYDEAAWLVLHALSLSPQENLSEPDKAVTADELARVRVLLQQRIDTRKPLAYLLHSAWFCGLEFYVDERVIVPRSPIAELIGNGFSPWLPSEPSGILDLCTGSGCIAIACALAFENAQVDATDISAEALAVAAINRECYALQTRLGLWQADIFQGLPPKRYDLIVSNPPYVDVHDMALLADEYRREPELALAAGTDGLDIVRRILRDAESWLTERGVLIVEVGNSQEGLIDAYPQLPFVWLEFEYGGDGVFLLTAEDLCKHRDSLGSGRT